MAQSHRGTTEVSNQGNGETMSVLFSKSKRQVIAYLALFSDIIAMFYGLNKGADMLGLAACMTAVTGLVGMYIFGETWRPHGNS